MKGLLDKLGELSRLGEMLEPSEQPKPGVEHVMVEIAPGVFRSLHRQKQPAGGRLLRELGNVKALHDSVKSKFEEMERGVRARRSGQR